MLHITSSEQKKQPLAKSKMKLSVTNVSGLQLRNNVKKNPILDHHLALLMSDDSKRSYKPFTIDKTYPVVSKAHTRLNKHAAKVEL